MCTRVDPHPVLSDGSVLFPERPELTDNRVGDCLSVSIQDDVLTARGSPYGSKLSATEKHSYIILAILLFSCQ